MNTSNKLNNSAISCIYFYAFSYQHPGSGYRQRLIIARLSAAAFLGVFNALRLYLTRIRLYAR